MFPASTRGGGQCMAFPDVCKVPAPPGPPIPTPFPNMASCSQAKGSSCSQRVKMLNKKVCTKKTVISRSQGDEAGTLKGLVSSTQMDEVGRKDACAKIKVEGASIVTAMRATGHNGSNANAPVGQQLSPSQTKIVCFG